MSYETQFLNRFSRC